MGAIAGWLGCASLGAATRGAFGRLQFCAPALIGSIEVPGGKTVKGENKNNARKSWKEVSASRFAHLRPGVFICFNGEDLHDRSGLPVFSTPEP